MPNIVDRFNVGGEDYYIEPPMDDVPTQGSHNAVQSGGVYDAISAIVASPTPVEGGTLSFSTGGAYSYLSELQKALGITRVAVHNSSKYFSGMATAHDRVFTCVQPDDTKVDLYYSENYGYSFRKQYSPNIPKGRITGAIYFGGAYIISFANEAATTTSVKGLYRIMAGGAGYGVLPGGLSYANTRVFHIAANDTIAVATTINGIMWSEDGLNWNLSNIGSANMHGDGAPPLYAGGVWVCSSYGSVYISQNGKNWTEYPAALGNTAYDVYDISYAHDLWYCIGYQGIVYWSEDAIHWTNTGTTAFTSHDYANNSVAVYCNGKYMLKNGMISDNGKTEWVSSSMPLTNTVYYLVKNKYGLVACVDSYNVAWSKDCLVWEVSGSDLLRDTSQAATNKNVGLLDNGDVATLMNYNGTAKFGYLCITKSPILPDIPAQA